MENIKPNNGQEDFQYKQTEIIRQKQIYYDSDEALVLPHHPRYYYDWLGSRYNSYPMEQKLTDLAFLVSQGFDLKGNIRDYKKERDEIITSAIAQTFVFYILYMRYGTCSHFTDLILRKLSENQLIKLFMDEVRLRYNSTLHEVETGGWNDDELVAAAGGDKATFWRLVKGVELTKKFRSK